MMATNRCETKGAQSAEHNRRRSLCPWSTIVDLLQAQRLRFPACERSHRTQQFRSRAQHHQTGNSARST